MTFKKHQYVKPFGFENHWEEWVKGRIKMMKLMNKKKIKKLKTLQKTKKNYNFLEISLVKTKKTLFKQKGTKSLSGIFYLKKS
jgi:hypothetical protein